MPNFLMEALRENNQKDHAFDNDSVIISYKTGFPSVDYFLGYKVNVHNENDEIVDQYNSIGISSGCYVTLIGKPSTGKTTIAIQIASNIVRPFESGSVIHYDLEKAMNFTRIQNLSRFSMREIEDGKYILKKGITSIQDIKSAIMKIYFEKTKNPEKYMYDTGKKDEFGNEIRIYQPTCVIIDSIPMLSSKMSENDKKDIQKLEDISSQTDRMRLTAEIGRFYSELQQYISEANIIVFSINQIKTNPGMGIVKSPSEILYLNQDEALPGGKAPQFLANYLFKFVAIGGEKYKEEDDGFDGFGLKMLIVKSRSNQAGQIVHLVYDKNRGVDSLRTSVEYAKELGCLNGNKNGYYFDDDKENKFTKFNMHEDFKNNRQLYKILYSHIIPELETHLSSILPEELEVVDDELDY
jgi:RecA/RadA recombinase